MLKKYVEDPTYVLHYQPLDIKPDASYIARLVTVIDTKEQVLRTQTIHWVKVQWEHHTPEAATWELRDQVINDYPHLLPPVCSYFNFTFGDQMF